MRTWVVIPAFLLLVGCQSDSSSSSSKNEPSTPTQTISPTSTQVPTSTAVKPSGNPSRLHQLKDLAVKNIQVGSHTIKAWVMDDDSKRQEGMMFLGDSEVKNDEGMIFVFDAVQPKVDHGFWMHNTDLPLDIIYIGADKKVINVGKGMPHSDATVAPKGDYKFVLELKQGTAEKIGATPGATVKF